MVDPSLLFAGGLLMALPVPFVAGAYTGYRNEPKGDAGTSASPYRRAVQSSVAPATFGFVLLVVAVVGVLSTIGHGGGPPPLRVVLTQIALAVFGVVVFSTGTTVAGSRLGQYVRT